VKDHGGLVQGVSNLWCYGIDEEIDHNLRSPTIISKNKNKKNTYCYLPTDVPE